MLNVDTTAVQVTYDAFDRAVEQNRGGSYTQIVYAPSGAKLALMTGTTLVKAFVPLPGGPTAVYASGTTGPIFYRHSDWLGSSRLASTQSRTKYFDVSYAPFGESYNPSGTADYSFTGQNQDTVSGYTGYDDFLFREYNPGQGRWMSPDPAGMAVVDPTNPQSWNRYAYVNNNPLALVDAMGLGCVYLDPAGDHVVRVSDDDCQAGDGGFYFDGPMGSVSSYWVDPNSGDVISLSTGACSGECPMGNWGVANSTDTLGYVPYLPSSFNQSNFLPPVPVAANNGPQRLPGVPKPPNPIESPSTKDKICAGAGAAVTYFGFVAGPGALSPVAVPSIITGGLTTAGEVGGFVIAPEFAVPVLAVAVPGALLLCL